MQVLKTKILKRDQDLVAYQQKVKRILGIEFPVAYLKQGRVRAFFNSDGELVAGYAFINKGPFRTISSIPENITTELPCDADALSEVTALFIDESMRSSVARIQFWMTFARELSTLPDKTHYVYAYDLEKVKLKKLYRMAKPTVLFEGRTLLLEGMTAESDEAIEVAECSRLMLLPVLGIPKMINRIFFKKPIREVRYLFNGMRNSA